MFSYQILYLLWVILNFFDVSTNLKFLLAFKFYGQAIFYLFEIPCTSGTNQKENIELFNDRSGKKRKLEGKSQATLSCNNLLLH